ncbi:MAG: AIR synthase-related protein, partial [Thermodesulfovibrionales bacterium]|nr:AIR synthase-related protein [Thermodesulfovibrionales bacterium]
PGGTRTNVRDYELYVTWGKGIPEVEKILMNDAQTSGGLLIFVPGDRKDKLVTALQKEGILAAHIGDVSEKGENDNRQILAEA